MIRALVRGAGCWGSRNPWMIAHPRRDFCLGLGVLPDSIDRNSKAMDELISDLQSHIAKWNNKEEEERFKAKIVEVYEKEGSSYYSTARLWDDGIIDPADTRKIIGLCISASLNCPAEDIRYGVFRM
ncbi:methylcrotonoyl-coa carboxylase beta chain [Quercus suber]|uniref:Methylcrotonoyl-coa carboxylase beta chain n=1 Tax=Quercus suber TaxID=58331 RepID=A0AAW0KFB5_QUESU